MEKQVPAHSQVAKGEPQSVPALPICWLHGEVKTIVEKYCVGTEHLDPVLSLSNHHSNASHSISTKLGVRSHLELVQRSWRRGRAFLAQSDP